MTNAIVVLPNTVELIKILAPHLAKIKELEAELHVALQAVTNREALLADATERLGRQERENAALRKRLVIDDAMVERAMLAYRMSKDDDVYLIMRAALTAAIGTDDANG